MKNKDNMITNISTKDWHIDKKINGIGKGGKLIKVIPEEAK